MSMEVPFFYFFSSVAVLSSLLVVFSPKPTRALLSLILVMGALTCLYVMLGASFVAMINLIVYAGAVLVLFLFVIMLQGTGASDVPLLKRFSNAFIFLSLLIPILFFSGMVKLAQSGFMGALANQAGDAKTIGMLLFTKYLLPFELISILLILAILAAVSLAKRDEA